ncbi:MAG: protein translocase subunit SecD [Coriobacteriales bacterium]|nr:protein translocase subunit SecD [Coriobacteriales bacterium]
MPDKRFTPKKRHSAIRTHVIFLILLVIMLVSSIIMFTPPSTKIKQGLDVQGGLSVVMQASTTDGSLVTPADMTNAQAVVERRVNLLGASEATVQVQGTNQLLVQMPGVVDQTQALETIGQTGVLEFCSVPDITNAAIKKDIEASNSNSSTSSSSDKPTMTDDTRIDQGLIFDTIKPSQVIGTKDNPVKDTAGNVQTITNNKVPAGEYVVNNPDSTDQTKNPTTYSRVVLKDNEYTPLFNGGQITNVSVDKASDTSQYYAVNITLNGDATKAFGDATTQLAKNKDQIAILLDKAVQSAPTVNEAITTGQVQITGNYDIDGANALKTVLQSGSLPVSLAVVNSQVVGPTAGQASLYAGILVALLGLLLVCLYLIFFYRGLGILTAGAIIVFSCLYLGLLGLLSALGFFALSLAGIAGIVLSIGTAADSSILVLERFKEEIRMGRSVRASSITGVKHAIITSIDADFVTLISALALYFIAIGSVKGFGLTLTLGVICDIITMLFFKAPTVRLLAPAVIAHHPGFWGIREDEELAIAGGEILPDAHLLLTAEDKAAFKAKKAADRQARKDQAAKVKAELKARETAEKERLADKAAAKKAAEAEKAKLKSALKVKVDAPKDAADKGEAKDKTTKPAPGKGATKTDSTAKAADKSKADKKALSAKRKPTAKAKASSKASKQATGTAKTAKTTKSTPDAKATATRKAKTDTPTADHQVSHIPASAAQKGDE